MKTPTRSLKAPLRTPHASIATMKAPARALAAACTLSAATLLCAGCGGKGLIPGPPAGGDVFLQSAAARGPDPFTDSTVRSGALPASVTRATQPVAYETGGAARSVSGATPGLYAGTRSVGSCDVERQVAYLTADRVKSRAFAQASGIHEASVPAYLRALTSVVLRADTRVTDHGFREGQVADRQSVLEAGTSVLVDNRGVPRVRCASGSPIDEPTSLRGTPTTHGRPWSAYRPAQVVVVTPAPQTIANITLVDIENTNTWIERRTGDDGRRDIDVRPPQADVQPPQVDVRPPRAAVRPPRSDEQSAAPKRFGISLQQPAPIPSGIPPLETPDPARSDAPHEKNLTLERPRAGCVLPSVTVTTAPLTTRETRVPGDVPPGDVDCPSASIAAAVTTPPVSPGAGAPSARPIAPTPGASVGGSPVPGDTSTESPLFDSPADAVGR
ncbi:DUF6777 domain-containing protein [Streptomyces sp. NPDC004589]|uniref:DUF6777 domain-containing protein n=1 Tax=Streptomyces sp. NPDC004589 TaxID=3154553 RepID=UPI0033A19193